MPDKDGGAVQHGVFIDDPKGLFIFRWYREVKADGSKVTGQRYQNAQTASYQLNLDNDGEVYLTKHSSQPRTYVLNKKDLKMLLKRKKKSWGPLVLSSDPR